MELKIFNVHLYSSEYAGIYEDYLIKAYEQKEVEDSIDLYNWGTTYEDYIEDPEDVDAVDSYYENLFCEVTEVTVEELLSEGYTQEEIEAIPELGKEGEVEW